MTDLQIPPHIDMTRRIAVDLAVTVATLGDTEQQLRGQLDEHQRDAATERDRIEAELVAARERAEKHLTALAETERRLTGELIDVGRRLQQHRDEAEQAQQSVADWCTRRAIDPADLPPLTGPIPAIPAEPTALPPAADPAPRDISGDPYAIPANRIGEPAPLPTAAEEPVAAHGPGMTLPDTGLNPAPLPPAGGPQPHRRPGLIDRITGRTGPQPVQSDGGPAEVPAASQDGAGRG